MVSVDDDMRPFVEFFNLLFIDGLKICDNFI